MSRLVTFFFRELFRRVRRFASAPSSVRSGSLGNRDERVVEKEKKRKEKKRKEKKKKEKKGKRTHARVHALWGRINSSITDGGFFLSLNTFRYFRDDSIVGEGEARPPLSRTCRFAVARSRTHPAEGEFLSFPSGKLSGLSEIDVAPGGSTLDTL